MQSDNNAASTPSVPTDDRAWSVSAPTDGPHYPETEAHDYTWGAFAGAAIELGGYGDLILVDPYSGRRLWLADCLDDEPKGSFLRGLRKLLDLAEATGFLDDPERADQANQDRLARIERSKG